MGHPVEDGDKLDVLFPDPVSIFFDFFEPILFISQAAGRLLLTFVLWAALAVRKKINNF